MGKYRGYRKKGNRRGKGSYMKIRSIVPPHVVKVVLRDQTEDDQWTTPVPNQPKMENSIRHILWNSLKDGDLFDGGPATNMIGYERLHPSYQAYRIPSAKISLTLRRKIEPGGSITVAAQEAGVYAFIYEPNDGAAAGAAPPPWFSTIGTVSTQEEISKAVREMKADSRCSWVYLPPMYSSSGDKARKRVTVSRRVSTVTSQRVVQASATRANTSLNGVLPSGAGGLDQPAKLLYCHFGSMLGEVGTYPENIEFDINNDKNCVFFHRQDNLTEL